MPKMSDSSLRALLAAHHSDALSATASSKLSKARSDAMSYYNGDMAADLPTEPGRSSAVTMDVSDTVRGNMPQLQEVCAGKDGGGKFQAVGGGNV